MYIQMENMFFSVKFFFASEKNHVGLRDHGSDILFLHKWYMYALKACIGLEEGCYHAKDMFRGRTLWYDLVTLAVTHDLPRSNGQKCM